MTASGVACSRAKVERIEHSVCIRIPDCVESDCIALGARHPTLDIQWLGGHCVIAPPDEDGPQSPHIDTYLGAILDRYDQVLVEVAGLGMVRMISVGLYYDVDAVAAPCPMLGAGLMQRLGTVGYDLELCIYPCSDMTSTH
ncbi:hypothetical protein [Ensifer soli]|uniref:hypothetical protein n=1 Tax=Ciceribacter sp. sgz301302 TaxID=3342379 RepID=UPI0035BAE21F